ncbi:MAG: molybdopterin converting factor, small subunit [Caldisphaera sp.]|jgi:molybdopterin synthase sulfur carrier subunit|uniref:MoaD/ThiS family protein n=1 Tax=Caldisphaera sp. TaxID=2060322 RepID=UPI000CC5D74D|nr:MoaD/ThiS family protein [Caldisphaera sp.]PMP59740.1 MAG: molybdopterin converting factor, small subunit [Caldisphaera sp.]PMP90906.1 MAG: molybdopterin converting factor, small subunit [Caldisphaera sp.]
MENKIKIKYLGYLTDLSGKQYEEREVNGEETIEDLLPFLKKLRSDDYIIVVNGRGADLKSKVKGGDIIVLLPQTGGG